MELRCSMCGTVVEVGLVEEAYREMKQGRIPVAVCPACARRVEAQAKRQTS